MQTKQTYINEIDIKRESRKTLKIVITQQGRVVVFVPYKMEMSKVQELVDKKANWINKKLAGIVKCNDDNKDLITYKQVLICGKRCAVQSGSTKKITLSNDIFYVPDKFFIENTYIYNTKKWFKNFAKELLVKRIEELSKTFRVGYSGVKIGDFKSKWGSCDSKKNIKLNYKLVMLPPVVIDYVILHELSHTYEMNHSKKFYMVLENFMPGWKQARLVLKEHNYLLTLYK